MTVEATMSIDGKPLIVLLNPCHRGLRHVGDSSELHARRGLGRGVR